MSYNASNHTGNLAPWCFADLLHFFLPELPNFNLRLLEGTGLRTAYSMLCSSYYTMEELYALAVKKIFCGAGCDQTQAG